MIVRDFDKQKIIPKAEVVSCIKKLPKAHIAGLQSIIFKPFSELRGLNIELDISENCKGAFYPEFRSIIIFDLVNRQMAKHIILHEIGHYVFHRYLNSYAKKGWTTQIWKRDNATTCYGKTNAVEDFSETYAYFAQGKHAGHIHHAKIRFMRENVFN